MSDNQSVIEGLLCPICLQDQQTIQQLQDHYESAHSGEKDLSLTLKNIFAKAKRKILKQDTTQDQDDDVLTLEKKSPNILSQLTWGSPEIGAVRQHTSWFRSFRTTRHENYTTETNKLIIRLGRLLEDPTVEPDKRKAYEKNLVSWVDDSDVKLCPGCARTFNLARRRHHCRLCGAIMCQPCSCFVDLQLAKKLVRPSKTSPTTSASKSPPHPRKDSLMALVTFSSSSHQQHQDGTTRVCVDCYRLLERRSHIQDQRHPDPDILELYQLMKNKMSEVESLVQSYDKIYDSLMSGENKYSLEEGKNLRAQITRGAETMDLLSRKLGSVADPPESRAAQLHKNIRKTVSHFLQSYVLVMPPLPTAAELQNLRREPGPSGWTPDHERPSEQGDPLLEQINNIRNYLGQAQRERRMDEVAILEANLRELETEYESRKSKNDS